jgi:hypothetical protein
VHTSHRRGRVPNGSARRGGDQHPLRPSIDDCRCVPPTIAGESENGSTRCDGDRQPPSLVQARILAGARLPPSRASPGTAPRGVAATVPPPLFRRVAATLRHKARAKDLPCSCLADDDYFLASFTSLEASSKCFFALVW